MSRYPRNSSPLEPIRSSEPKITVCNPGTIDEIDNFIRTQEHTFVCDTPKDHFGGATCAHFLSRYLWGRCQGLDESLIYWGVNDIDIHNRLCMEFKYGGDLEAHGMKFYHLEHYDSRSNPNNVQRRCNVYTPPTQIAANNALWWLAGINLEYKVQPKAKFSLAELYEQVVADEPPEYDSRLGVAMTPDQYRDYRGNTGHTYYHFLSKLVKRYKPNMVLELGTSIGRSALFMMVSLPEQSTLTTVDIGSHLRTDLAPFAYDSRLKIVFGDDLDQEVIDQIGDGFDMLFIDTAHNLEQIKAEWAVYEKKLADEAIVVMDDIHLSPEMTSFWDSLEYDKIDTGRDLHFSGFGLFHYRRNVN